MRTEKFICDICGADATSQAVKNPKLIISRGIEPGNRDHLCSNAACLFLYVGQWNEANR